MGKIYYKQGFNDLLLTACPFLNKKSTLSTRVGSKDCQECGSFRKINEDENWVDCLFSNKRRQIITSGGSDERTKNSL